MELHALLKEKRLQQELTQEQLAEKIFVSNKTISNWENGKTTPDLDSLIRLATFFHLSLDNLLLEGSDTVENIKKIEAAKLARKYFFITWTTNILFILIIISQKFFGSLSDQAFFLLTLAIFFNGAVLLHFAKSVRETHNGHSFYHVVKSENKLLLGICIILMMVVVVAMFLRVILSS